MKNNKKMIRKSKTEKRRLAFEKQNVKKEQNLARYGAEGGSALIMAKTTEFNHRVIAAVLSLVFVLTTLVVGVNVVTNATSIYEIEDAPVEMRVMVNDEWLKQGATDDAFSVQFPSGLIENGTISQGISFQKEDDNGTVVVDSIQNTVDFQLFGDQSAIPLETQKHVTYLGAFIEKRNGESEEISNVRISDNGETQYLVKAADTSAITDVKWVPVADDDILLLSFNDSKTEPIVVDAENNTILLESIDDSISVKQDGSIPDSNGILPSMVRGLFKAPSAQSVSHLEAVDFNILYNTSPRDDLTISVPAGNIETSMASSSVKSQEESLLYSKAIWKKAFIWKWDSSNSNYIQYEIKNVGKYEDSVYYSIEGDNEDTGILLGENDKLYLQYELYFDVSYIITPEEGGNIEGATTRVAYGKSLSVNVSANTYYQLSSLTYNIQIGPASYKYGTAQPVSNQTIPASDIVGDVFIYADFSRDTQYVIDANGINHGHVCATHSLDYSNSVNGDDIAEYGDIDPENNIRHGITVSAGGTAYLVMFGQKANNRSDTYTLNAIWLNGESVNVPTAVTTTYSATDPGNIATTTLSNGSIVTITRVANDSDTHVKNNPTTVRPKYIIKIEDVKENIDFNVYFRHYSETKTYLIGLRGIANTSASHPVPALKRWVLFAPSDAGSNILYFMDENNSYKTENSIAHSYVSYNHDDFVGSTKDSTHFDDAFFSLIGHKLAKNHFHNVYMAKAKPGYNPQSIVFNDLICDYSASEGQAVYSQKKDVVISSSTTESSFQQSYDVQDTWRSGLYSGTAYFCKWDTFLTDDNIASGSLDVNGYSVLTNEAYDDNYWDTYTNVAIKRYTPFITGAKTRKYTYGIMLPEFETANNYMQVNATAYKYKIQYLMAGVDQSDRAVTAGNLIFDDSENSKYISEGSEKIIESKRHAIEKKNNTASNADENEFSDVEGNTVVLPLNTPTHETDSTSRYTFNYWKLVKCDPTTGNYVSDVLDSNGNTIIKYPGETFVIDSEACGYDKVAGTTLYPEQKANLSDYDVYSSNPSKGYAWGNYSSSDPNALTFTFMPVWSTEYVGNYVDYSVLAYKDTPNDAITDSSGKPIVETRNGKKYYLYYKNDNNKAAPGSEIVSLNQHYPMDGLIYNMNETLTDDIIDSLTPNEDDQIKYYYDASSLAVTLRETVSGSFSNDDDTFSITLILIPPEEIDTGSLADMIDLGNNITATKQADNTYVSTINKEGDSSITSLRIPYGYTLNVSSVATKNNYYETPVMKYAQGEAPDATTGTEFTADTDLSITQNTDILIHNVCNEIPITGIQHHKNTVSILLAVLVTLAGCAGVAFIYRKKDEFVEQ